MSTGDDKTGDERDAKANKANGSYVKYLDQEVEKQSRSSPFKEKKSSPTKKNKENSP